MQKDVAVVRAMHLHCCLLGIEAPCVRHAKSGIEACRHLRCLRVGDGRLCCLRISWTTADLEKVAFKGTVNVMLRIWRLTVTHLRLPIHELEVLIPVR